MVIWYFILEFIALIIGFVDVLSNEIPQLRANKPYKSNFFKAVFLISAKRLFLLECIVLN